MHGYVVTLDVNEKRRLTGGVSTLVGTNDGSLVGKYHSSYTSYKSV